MTQLIAYVHIVDPDGQPRVLAPGDAVPNWALAQITNPKAWKDGRVPAARSVPAATANAQQADGAQPPTSGMRVPPRGGAGSGRDPWAAYARAVGHDAIAELATRDEILTALQVAGVPVE